MIPKTRINWKRLQPTSLRHAMELCKDHARIKLNRSMEGIAEQMGLADHWTLYKWFQSGKLPLNLLRPFENACGVDYVTRWVATSAGKLLVDMPTGRSASQAEMVEFNSGFSAALQLLTDFYAQNPDADQAALQDALTSHMQQVAWHQANVAQHANPQLDFTTEGPQ